MFLLSTDNALITKKIESKRQIFKRRCIDIFSTDRLFDLKKLPFKPMNNVIKRLTTMLRRVYFFNLNLSFFLKHYKTLLFYRQQKRRLSPPFFWNLHLILQLLRVLCGWRLQSAILRLLQGSHQSDQLQSRRREPPDLQS